MQNAEMSEMPPAIGILTSSIVSVIAVIVFAVLLPGFAFNIFCFFDRMGLSFSISFTDQLVITASN